MKCIFIIFAILLPMVAFPKDVFEYTCSIDKEIKVELSLIAKDHPNLGLFYQNKKFALCDLENTPMTQYSNPKAHTTESVWVLKLKQCNYYLEKYKSKLEVVNEVIFQESKEAKGASFLTVGKGLQPVICIGKK